MAEHPISGLMETSMQKIKEMADANTVIGEPISVGDGTIIIPVSKVSLGFASGGSDFPSKKEKDMFGGASGAGLSVNPVAFLVVKGSDVRIMQLYNSASTADRLVNTAPDIIDKIANMFKKDETTQEQE